MAGHSQQHPVICTQAVASSCNRKAVSTFLKRGTKKQRKQDEIKERHSGALSIVVMLGQMKADEESKRWAVWE